MKRAKPWWHDPQKVVSVLVGLGAVGGWIITSFVADAKQSAKVEEVAKDVEALDETVTEHERALEQAEIRQQLLQQDVGFIKQGMQDVLQELKRKK